MRSLNDLIIVFDDNGYMSVWVRTRSAERLAIRGATPHRVIEALQKYLKGDPAWAA